MYTANVTNDRSDIHVCIFILVAGTLDNDCLMWEP